MFFDTHAHFDDEKFNEDRDEAIQTAFSNGVTYILNASSDIASSIESISLSQQYENIYAAVGVHPHNVEHINDNTMVTLGDFAQNEKVVAIGEAGLDYYYENSPIEMQKHWFAKQVCLARSLELPIIVHDRDAHEDVLNIIKVENAKAIGGIFHCYSGSVEMAKELLKNNFLISIAGPVTFKNSRRLIEVVEYVPMEYLLIETDCPYLTPEPHRGKRNFSGYVPFVAKKIAEIKGISVEEVARITTENAKRIFKI